MSREYSVSQPSQSAEMLFCIDFCRFTVHDRFDSCKNKRWKEQGCGLLPCHLPSCTCQVISYKMRLQLVGTVIDCCHVQMTDSGNDLTNGEQELFIFSVVFRLLFYTFSQTVGIYRKQIVLLFCAQAQQIIHHSHIMKAFWIYVLLSHPPGALWCHFIGSHCWNPVDILKKNHLINFPPVLNVFILSAPQCVCCI